MPSQAPAIVAVVLAAGSARRFGSPKLAAPILGRPVLDWALAPVRAHPRLSRVVVVVDAKSAALSPTVTTGVDVIPCPDAHAGVSASLRAGIDAAGSVDAVLVTLGDQPLITPAAVGAVLTCFTGAAPAARATYGGRPGHPVLIKRELFDTVRALDGDQGAGPLLEEVGCLHIECSDFSSDMDIDTADDLSRARRRLSDLL